MTPLSVLAVPRRVEKTEGGVTRRHLDYSRCSYLAQPLGSVGTGDPGNWHNTLAMFPNKKDRLGVNRRYEHHADHIGFVFLDDIPTKCGWPPVDPHLVMRTSKGNHQLIYLIKRVTGRAI